MIYEAFGQEIEVSATLWNQDERTRGDVTDAVKRLWSRTAQSQGFEVFGEAYINIGCVDPLKPEHMPVQIIGIVGRQHA